LIGCRLFYPTPILYPLFFIPVMRNSLMTKAWKIATALVVLVIILNPEMSVLALFIDAIGLEIFIMLLRIQITAIVAPLIYININAIFSVINRLCAQTRAWYLRSHGAPKPTYLMLLVASQASIMHLLVFSTALGITYHAI